MVLVLGAVAVVGTGALLALTSRRAPVAISAPPSEPQPVEALKVAPAQVEPEKPAVQLKEPKPEPGGELGGVVKAVSGALSLTKGAAALGSAIAGTSVGVGATGAAIAGFAATGALGYAITGDAWGAVGAFGQPLLTGLTSNVNIFSAQAGNVGRLLGKEIDRLLGGDGSTDTGVSTQAAGYLGALVLVSFGFSTLPLVGALFALTVGIGSAVSDLTRLAYGQSGIRADLLREFDVTFANARDEMSAHVSKLAKGEPIDARDVQRVVAAAAAFALANTREKNARRERVWLAKPRGAGVDAAYHRRFGVDRGHWLEDFSPVVAHARAQVKGGTLEELTDEPAMALLGTRAANVGAYLEAMRETWGFGVTAERHARWWRDAGAFTGDIDAGGNLTAWGFVVDWQGSFDAAAQSPPKPPVVRPYATVADLKKLGAAVPYWL